jgi:hypothetical protein
MLALDMIRRFRLACRGLRWVAGDAVYGADPELRDWLEEHQIGLVLGVRCDLEVTTAVGRRRVDALAKLVPADAWETYDADGPAITVIIQAQRPGSSKRLRRGPATQTESRRATHSHRRLDRAPG